MSAANIAYLVLVLVGYAAFIVVLGAVWLRAALEPSKPSVAAKPQATSAREPEARTRRKAA